MVMWRATSDAQACVAWCCAASQLSAGELASSQSFRIKAWISYKSGLDTNAVFSIFLLRIHGCMSHLFFALNGDMAAHGYQWNRCCQTLPAMLAPASGFSTKCVPPRIFSLPIKLSSKTSLEGRRIPSWLAACWNLTSRRPFSMPLCPWCCYWIVIKSSMARGSSSSGAIFWRHAPMFQFEMRIADVVFNSKVRNAF